MLEDKDKFKSSIISALSKRRTLKKRGNALFLNNIVGVSSAQALEGDCEHNIWHVTWHFNAARLPFMSAIELKIQKVSIPALFK